MHDVIMLKADEAETENEGSGKPWLIIYMVLSLGFLSCAGTGLAYLFMNYAGCRIGMFFTIVN